MLNTDPYVPVDALPQRMSAKGAPPRFRPVSTPESMVMGVVERPT
jgi:hypothetical protein